MTLHVRMVAIWHAFDSLELYIFPKESKERHASLLRGLVETVA